MNDDLYYQIALTQVKGIGVTLAKHLDTHCGSARMVFDASTKDLLDVNGVGEQLLSALKDKTVFQKADKEMSFIEKHAITGLYYKEDNYPSLLKSCADAPYLMFYKGNLVSLRKPTIAVIGTRKATHYGRDLCEALAKELAALAPNVNIISGLAYGIDIAIHRSALDAGLSTVGVLAHGLDRIYPDQHRQTAVGMLKEGGLLTEFLTETKPDKQNFVLRNRIVAGMSAATVVIESASSGGALITAGMTSKYKRQLFAFPGKVGDAQSEGCLHLIKNRKAEMITSASDLVERMGWATALQSQDIQRKLFPEFRNEELPLMDLLAISPCRIDDMAVKVDMPIHKLSAMLFEMELKGLVRAYPGGIYKRMV